MGHERGKTVIVLEQNCISIIINKYKYKIIVKLLIGIYNSIFTFILNLKTIGNISKLLFNLLYLLIYVIIYNVSSCHIQCKSELHPMQPISHRIWPHIITVNACMSNTELMFLMMSMLFNYFVQHIIFRL